MVQITKENYQFTITASSDVIEKYQESPCDMAYLCEIKGDDKLEMVEGYLSKDIDGKYYLYFSRLIKIKQNEKNLIISGVHIEGKAAKKLISQKEEIKTMIRKSAVLPLGITNWEITEEIEKEKGRKVQVYHHALTIGEQTLKFMERKESDFGIVIHPEYPIIPNDMESDEAVIMQGDGMNWFEICNDEKGWIPVRRLTKEEEICYESIERYGIYSGLRI